MKIFEVLTLFPAMFEGPMTESILGKAVATGHIKIHIHDIRDYTHDRHRVVDDVPYGGGPGMIMKPEPIVEAVEKIRSLDTTPDEHKIILMTPQGKLLDQDLTRELALENHHIIICGHYGGIDERVSRILNPLEISIGDYVLSGGEIPAMVLIDAVSRMVPGVVGCPESVEQDCFIDGLLSYPQYTRPPEFKSLEVPDVLTSGDHKKIRDWRKKQSMKRTRERRPDLFVKASLTESDMALLMDPENADQDNS
jgi:tRNA (guanine37-N1)-methyltransferase